MISSAVFARYAKSLAEVVFEVGQEPAVTADLDAFMQIFQAVPDLAQVFDSPAIKREAKEKLLASLTGAHPVAGITENFLQTLLRHNRLRYFPEIVVSYRKLVNTRKNIVSARVTVAAPLSAGEVENLSRSLGQAASSTVVLDVKTDAGIVGGMVVQVGSTVFDGSIRTQLSEIKRQLAEG